MLLLRRQQAKRADSSSLRLRISEVTGSGAKRSCRSPGKAQACFTLALLYPSAPCLEVQGGFLERRRYSAFATVCCCAVVMKPSVLSSAFYDFFFLSETLHSCHGVAVLRGEACDKNAGRNVVRLPVISCRYEGRPSVVSEAMLLAAMP